MSKIKVVEEFDDELEGSEVLPKKKEKKKKSKEEKIKDRRTVFFVLVLVLVSTLVFWLKASFEGRNSEVIEVEEFDSDNSLENEEENTQEKGFFVKYDI